MQAHRLDALDGMRGIAIGIVLWYHLWQISWLDPHYAFPNYYFTLSYIPIGGFLGVELFFFISAFCLSYPYVRAHFAERALPSVRHFAFRRFIKIVPSYLLCLFAVILLAAFPNSSFAENIHWENFGAFARDIAAHLTFLHTYFYESYASINGVLWTLGIEVQFYVLFPLLVLVLLRAPISLAVVMTAIAIAYRTRISACCRTPIFDHNIDQLLGFLDFFAAGMLCAYAYEWIRLRKPKLAATQWLWTLVAMGGFIWCIHLFQNLEHERLLEHFAEWWVVRNATFYAVAIFAATFGSLLAIPTWHRLLANPILVFLSIISYNLYLWHQVLIRWAASLPWPIATKVRNADPRYEWGVTIVGLIAAVGVATAITYWFERPLLRLKPEDLGRRVRGLFGRRAPLELSGAPPAGRE